MRALPFVIGVRSPDPTLPVQQVVCRRSLRLLIRRRETFEASWQDRAVILKVFGEGSGQIFPAGGANQTRGREAG